MYTHVHVIKYCWSHSYSNTIVNISHIVVVVSGSMNDNSIGSMTHSSSNTSRICSRDINSTFHTHYHDVSHHHVVCKNTYIPSSQKVLYSYLPIQKVSLSNWEIKKLTFKKLKYILKMYTIPIWEPCTKHTQCCFYFTLMWLQ